MQGFTRTSLSIPPIGRPIAPRLKVRTLASSLPIILALLLIAFLATYNLEYYPRTWFDEGWNLQAARHLAETGRYGTRSSDGSDSINPIELSTGPTVIVPIALVFKVWGIGLAQARLVMVGYILLAALGLYSAGRRLYGSTVATVAVLVFASLTEFGVFAHGRHVLGEIAALCYLYWGACLLVQASNAKKDLLYLGAGLAFGLTILTKSQFVLLIPVLLALWLIARAGHERPSIWQMLRLLLALATPLAIWYSYQLYALGPLEFLDQQRQAITFSGVNAGPFGRALAGVNVLISSQLAIWGIAGLLYVWLITARRESSARLEWLLLPGFATLSLVWFVGLSIGWSRYAVPAIVTSSLFLAKLLCDLIRRVVSPAEPRIRSTIGMLLADPAATATSLVLVLLILSGIALNGVAIARANDNSPQVFAALVAKHVDPAAIIECTQPEIEFLSGRICHRPSAVQFTDRVAVAFLHRMPESSADYRVPSSASYLIHGPFSKLFQLYGPELAIDEFRRIASYGEYDLYRREAGQ